MRPSWTMPNAKASSSGDHRAREPFLTIDDLVGRAEKLYRGIKKLSEFKYPLQIRRGVRKEVIEHMNDDRESAQIKGSGQPPTQPGRVDQSGGVRVEQPQTDPRLHRRDPDAQRHALCIFEDRKRTGGHVARPAVKNEVVGPRPGMAMADAAGIGLGLQPQNGKRGCAHGTPLLRPERARKGQVAGRAATAVRGNSV